MGEKSWASLAPLLDMRRYVESIIAGIKIPAHPEFRLAVTMNEDASTFDVPDYIQSRLQPQIEVGFPSRDEEMAILESNLPEAPTDVLTVISEFLQRSHQQNKPYTTRDGVNMARYALKLLHLGQISQTEAIQQAVVQTLDAAALSFFLEKKAEANESVINRLQEILLLGSPLASSQEDFSPLDEFDDDVDLADFADEEDDLEES